MGNMEVAAEDQFYSCLLGCFEGFFGAAGEVVPRKGDELGQMVVHNEHAQGLARGAVIPRPDLLKLMLRGAPTLQGPAKGGIDSLIQGTIVRDQLELGRKDTSERVTLVFEKDHVDKLKTIARMEQKYLKNIVTELIQEFIRTYESEHGKIS